MWKLRNRTRSQGKGGEKKTFPAGLHLDFVSGISCSHNGVEELENVLQLGSDRTLLEEGLESYILPEQQSPWLPHKKRRPPETKEHETSIYPDQEILQVAKEQHVRAESFMVYNVLNAREVQCSNTLEDELDPELPGQAIVYRPARQRIYAVLLGARQGPSELCPVVKEWFVYPGNALKQPDLVPAESLNLPGGTPSLQRLWLAEGPEVKKLRYHTFLACFNVQELLEELSCLDALIAGVCCLLIYLTLEIKSLCLEDLEAYVAQILCICGKSAAQLSHIQLPWVNPRAVHLGSLFVRGLTTLISANSTCGFPFKMADLMPWEVFDGKLFHLKYQQSHQGISVEERLENNESMVKQFHKLMALIVRSCSQKNRIIRTRPHRSEGEGYEQRNPSVRGQGPPFQSGQRFPSFPSHHNQGSGIQWRGSRTGAVGNDMQLPDRRYRSGYRGRSRQVQLAPRWSGYQEPYAGRR
nr:PREDICTED: constitutive coactivator of peroxisome proliferator-activated receptor gamma isoform X3 [Latimeria chalumnae]|eukprot:XP_006005955.1 PREDICTED: constitutive coactivator of peroxisome proliferator-activated receptor gamma isoform X3 [Latimeria chalumnae]